jgi:hypothetical protein
MAADRSCFRAAKGYSPAALSTPYSDREHDAGRSTTVFGTDHAPAGPSGPRSRHGLDRGLERDGFMLNRCRALDFWWSMIFSKNRYPRRIKSGAGFFRIML